MKLLYPFTIILLLIFASLPLKAETYYVSLTGKDSNTGTTITNAWGTIGKVNSTPFLPGDSILFEGGSIFSGGIFIGANEKGKLSQVAGTAKNPIVFSSYGAGRATISSGKIAGFKAYNAAGIKVEKLIFTGAGSNVNESFGVEFYMDVPDTLLEFVCVDNVEVFGYREAGIAIASQEQTTGGFKDVSITNSSSHDNGDAGISTFALGEVRHQNIYIGYNKVFNNIGLDNKWWNHSGSGIIIGGVDGGLIEYCEAYNNGGNAHSSNGGPVGIWGYNSDSLILQFNESHHNKTSHPYDGGGFNFDGGCTNSIMQFNYSHDNAGPGFAVAQYAKAPPMYNIIIRFNISENDVRSTNFGAINLWTASKDNGIEKVYIYYNTIVLEKSVFSNPMAIYIMSENLFNINFFNNIIQVTDNVDIIRLVEKSNIKFINNNYWAKTGSLEFFWPGFKTYFSLEEWRAATGQETLNGSPTGYSVDPELKDPGKGVTIGNPTKLYTLTGYELKESSPLIGKGLDLYKEFGIDVGKYDYFGNSLEGLEEFSIGAHQVVPATPLPVTLTSFTATKQGDAALLEWETASERNSRGFGVEVSSDGKVFRALGFVASNFPNSNQKQNYNYLDTELDKKGTRYYRLRQVDLDGSATYSEVQAVTFEGEVLAGMSIYPNPFTEGVTLEVTGERKELLQVTIADPLGRTVLETAQTIQVGKNTFYLPLPEQYPTGLYLLTASYGDKHHRIKLIRQKR